MDIKDIEEIKEVEVDEANQLLSKNYTLIKVPVKLKQGDEEKIVYVLAK